jgi:hypothetical protein
MKARLLVPLVGVVVAVPAIYLLFPKADAEEAINPDSNWKPTSAEIESAIISGPVKSESDERLNKFAQLFKQRYRDHQRAVGMKFISKDEIKAMFEPAIPRWEMTRIASQADIESSRIFGKHFEIGIYETYITMIRKIGVMKFDPRSGVQVVRFSPEYARPKNTVISNQPHSVAKEIHYFSELTPIPDKAIRVRGSFGGMISRE